MKKEESNPSPYQKQLQLLCEEVDFFLFQEKSSAFVQIYYDETQALQWRVFCKEMQALSEKNPQKLMLMQMALPCFANKLDASELAQLISLALHVKSACGLGIYSKLLEAPVPAKDRQLSIYLEIMQLLIELHEQEELLSLLQDLPDVERVLLQLHAKKDQALALKYPKRDIDAVLAYFAKEDELTRFPLKEASLQAIKLKYQNILELNLVSNSIELLKSTFLEQGRLARKDDPNATTIMIGIAAEMMRRRFKIWPYDTQFISILAILEKPDATLKGRIAQIKTGEGKSNILAILIAVLAGQGRFVDVITSADYLAKRDCHKYQPFFQDLGLTAGHICYQIQSRHHFHPQILYGTNSDFEFALLRDGLNQQQIRYSYPLGENHLVQRPRDVVLIDEVDNMLLDCTGAARMAIPGPENDTWIYKPILEFVLTHLQNQAINMETVSALRSYLTTKLGMELIKNLSAISDLKLRRWLRSAQIAYYERQENRDYVVHDNEVEIVDYANTGRISKGCQWQHGVHQFLQSKHGIMPKPESLTVSSVSHPTYFGGYQNIYGVTGTMGELIEREEIEEIYQLDSFDVPPHRPSLRKVLPPLIVQDAKRQQTALLKDIQEKQRLGRPNLVLFESIHESNEFSQFLTEKGMEHQLLNEQQRESEVYIITRAGEAGKITIATNTAGRGTDIILSPESLEAGGLHMIFAFYPENVRVEGQGFGRAGRQGQPGTCCMILHMQDSRILSLLASAPKVSILQWLLSSRNDAETLEFLHELRNKKIQTESRQRRQMAKMETVYFSYLNGFFNQMQALYAQLQTQSTQELLLNICTKTEAYFAEEDIIKMPVSKENADWQPVYKHAQLLLENHYQGKIIDWSSFIYDFKNAYINTMQIMWAVFYSKLQNEASGMDIATLEDSMKAAYSALNLEKFLNMSAVQSSLKQILAETALACGLSVKAEFSGPHSLLFFKEIVRKIESQDTDLKEVRPGF